LVAELKPFEFIDTKKSVKFHYQPQHSLTHASDVTAPSQCGKAQDENQVGSAENNIVTKLNANHVQSHCEL
jgi:hypothetical protein